MPEPRFVRVDDRGRILVYIEHVEFYFNAGPQERIWAKSLIGEFQKTEIEKDKNAVNRFITLESKRRGYI